MSGRLSFHTPNLNSTLEGKTNRQAPTMDKILSIIDLLSTLALNASRIQQDQAKRQACLKTKGANLLHQVGRPFHIQTIVDSYRSQLTDLIFHTRIKQK